MRKAFVLAALALTACNRDAPPAPTEEQSGRLNEAEDMLNGMATNEEGPEAKAPDPSANSN